MRKRHTAEDRERLIAEVRATGEVPRVVAERLGVCASSAYRWVKEASAPGAPVFARVVPSRAGSRTGLIVQLGRALIRVESGFDAELLRAVVGALGESP
jgi:soluble lytic murein transglycosylase-like protein